VIQNKVTVCRKTRFLRNPLKRPPKRMRRGIEKPKTKKSKNSSILPTSKRASKELTRLVTQDKMTKGGDVSDSQRANNRRVAKGGRKK